MNHPFAMHLYSERLQRLALGVDLIDVLREKELVRPVRIDIERGLPHLPPPCRKDPLDRSYSTKWPGNRFRLVRSTNRVPKMLLRHFSGRYVLLYHPSLRETVDLRIYTYQRYYIPRRLSVPLLTLEAIDVIEEAEESDYSLGRVRHPVLFPGAAYDVFGAATGLRGRILRDGLPMRWAHIEAHTVASDQLVGRARGDDRGEFLMLLSPMAALDVELNSTIDVRVSIAGPAEVPVPPTADLPALDPLWDVPLERLPPAGENDDVSAGNQLPTGYVRSNSASREVAFQVGRVLSGVEVEAFIFSPP